MSAGQQRECGDPLIGATRVEDQDLSSLSVAQPSDEWKVP